MHDRRTRSWLAAALLAVIATLTAVAPATAGGRHHHPDPSPDDLLPIVFVHGQQGSAQQFETQAMRFTSNGYPQDLLHVFEYNFATFPPPDRSDDLDAFIDGVLEETGAEQVHLVAFDMGTQIAASYLSSSEDGEPRVADVASYVHIDSFEPYAPVPADLPAIGIWGYWNSGRGEFGQPDTDATLGPDAEGDFHFPEMGHTEVLTSAETFAVMYEFLTGEEPRTTDILPQPPGKVTIAGRAVRYAVNAGYAGATVELWRVRGETGQRIGSEPVATLQTDDDGAFGPVRVHPRKHYELALTRPDGGVHHFYFEPFRRTDHFLRLHTEAPGLGVEDVPTSEETSYLTIVRQLDFWSDLDEASDAIAIDGTNVLSRLFAPRTERPGVVRFSVFDERLDGESDLTGDPATSFPYLAGADFVVPASPGGTDTVTVEVTRRGGETTTVNVPNWPSAGHRITIQLRDDDQELETFGQRVVRHRRRG